MKRWVSLLVAGALMLTAAGCTGQNPEAAPSPGESSSLAESSQPSAPYVEELRVGTTAAIDGTNVMTENGIFGKLNYNAVVTAPFVVTDENGEVQPFFMTSWELSDDLNQITATFATDQGLTWHDGEPVTMDDVVFTFQYLIDRKSGYRTGFYYMIDTPEFPGWGSCNIPEYSEAYRAVFFSSSYDEYLENIKNMQELNAEQLFGISLCWEKCYFPYRTDRYEGWNNYPGRGVINNSTWYNLRPIA